MVRLVEAATLAPYRPTSVEEAAVQVAARAAERSRWEMAARPLPEMRRMLGRTGWFPDSGFRSESRRWPIYAVSDVAVLRGRRLRFSELGDAVRAPPQFGQNPDAWMCMWQLGQTVSEKPMWAASSINE